ncbi:TIGR03545 family protein [Pleionea sediminis]|uniref:TIGR03545 family protein n=1 Tax=Pleionea sediminis TaxID=2569479 RepID=UPI0011858EA9|nr:TIGR03545 family protein [Pleionea sediminis]
MMKLFRLSGIAIVAVFGLLAWILITFFVNDWISDAVESGGSKVNGATVSLSGSQLGWLDGSLQLDNIEIADPDDLMRNRLQLELLKFDLSIQELLKGNFHVDELSLKSIALNQERVQKASLYKKNSQGDSSWSWPETIVEKSKSVDPNDILKKVDIRSPELYQQFSDKVSQMRSSWETAASQLPDEEKLNKHKQDYQQLKEEFKSANTLEKIKISKELKQLTSKIKKDKQQITDFKKQVESDIDSIKEDWKLLQKQVDKDTDLAMSIVNLTPEGMKHIAASFLGEGAAGWVELVLDNTDVIKKLATPSSKEEVKKPAPREGIDIPFGNEPVRPSFWVKKADVSGTLNYDSMVGRVNGKAFNLANRLIPGNPMSGELNFVIPNASQQKEASGQFNFSVVANKQSTSPINANFSVSNWPVENWRAASSALTIRDASANIQMELRAGKEKTELTSTIRLSDYDVQLDEKSSSSTFNHLVEVVRSAENIELNIAVMQQQKDVEFSVTSNLDELFFAKIREELQAKAEKLKSEVKQQIQSQVQGQREKIEQKLASLTNYKQVIADKVNLLDKLN